MEHPTEYIIEQFVLRAPEIVDQEQEISEHLSVCETCNALSKEIRKFYFDVAVRLEHTERLEVVPARSLVARRSSRRRSSNGLMARDEVFSSVSVRHQTISFVRHHPVASASAIFGALAFMILGTITFTGSRVDNNPSYSTLNAREGTVSVYNAANKVLFTAPWEIVIPAAESNSLEEMLRRQILVTHPAGARNSIILTTLKLGKEAWDKSPETVRIVNGEGEVKSRFPSPSGNITFRGRQYNSPMGAAGLTISSSSPAGSTELIVRYSAGRSPHAFQRMDFSGKNLGTYWHFGGLDLDTLDVDNDGSEELLLYGVNDLDDYTKLGTPVLAVLNPQQITGTTESSASRGFGFEASNAELCYIAFPVPEVVSSRSRRMMVFSVRGQRGGPLDVFVGDGTDLKPDEWMLGYDAYLDASFRVTQIKPNDLMIDTHRKLYAQGIVHVPLSEEYLRTLISRVRYWDGHRWSSNLTSVRHDSTSAASLPH